jgi:hypothetical protein
MAPSPPANTEDPVFVIDNLPSSLRQSLPHGEVVAVAVDDRPAGGGVNHPPNQNEEDNDDEDEEDNDSFHAPSVDTTYLASSVGSVVGPTRTAFLRSVTFLKDEPDDLRWDISFTDGDADADNNNTWLEGGGGGRNNRQKKKKKNKMDFGLLRRCKSVTVASISGHLTLSKIQVGDVVTKINHKTIGPSYNAERVSQCLQRQVQDTSSDIISIQTGNENGMDTIVQVTIIKPRPDMTAQELGLGVWW